VPVAALDNAVEETAASTTGRGCNPSEQANK